MSEHAIILPKERKLHPFDAVCIEIIEALQRRSFNVPGIRISFQEIIIGRKQYLMLKEIAGLDFCLTFCKAAGFVSLKNLSSLTPVVSMVIPCKELSIFTEGGPLLVVYVGECWEYDLEWFTYSGKINSKKNKERRRYLRYLGSLVDPKTNCEVKDISGKPRPYLRHSDSLGNEYPLREKEPETFVTQEVFQEFAGWLKENALAQILRQPIPEAEKINFASLRITSRIEVRQAT